MIHLHCTKKLSAKLPLHQNGRLRNQHPNPFTHGDTPDVVSPLSGWHANLILIQRYQCVVFVHDTTRFPVLVPALKKADFAELDDLFVDCFMNTLLNSGADDELMRCAHNMLAPLVCDTQCDRSVQGTVNQLGQDLAAYIDYEDIAIAEITGYSLGARLADRPCTVKGQKGSIWPQRAMRELLLNAASQEL